MITEDNEKKTIEQMGNQDINIEENWHGSKTSSTKLRMTDFEV